MGGWAGGASRAGTDPEIRSFANFGSDFEITAGKISAFVSIAAQ
jgi:hypothetical protein